MGHTDPGQPGDYTVEATAPGKQPWTKQVTIAPAPGTTDVDIPPLADAPPAPPPPPPALPPPVASTPAPPPPVGSAAPPPRNVPQPGKHPPSGYGAPRGYGGPAGGNRYGEPPPAWLGPPTMDYEEGMLIPWNYQRGKRIRLGLVIGGALTFGNSYVLSVIAAGIEGYVDKDDSSMGNVNSPKEKKDSTWLYIPVAGPFGYVFKDMAKGAWAFALVVDGVAQAGGLALGIAGLAWKKELLVRKDSSAQSFVIAPMVLGKGTMGLGIVGSM